MALGSVLGPSWGLLGSSWALLGPSWGHLGAPLGLLGAILGPSWGHLEAFINSKTFFKADLPKTLYFTIRNDPQHKPARQMNGKRVQFKTLVLPLLAWLVNLILSYVLWTVLVNICICLYAGGMSPCCATQICSVMVLFAAAAIPACETFAAAFFLPSFCRCL